MARAGNPAQERYGPAAWRVWATTFAAVKTRALLSVFRYAWAADTIYDVHAPRAFGFLGEVIEDQRHFHAFDAIEVLRKRYLASDELLELHDAGAGSQVQAAKRRTLSDVVRNSATSARFGRYLFKCVDYCGARRVLELGSNLGIGACYLAAALPPDGRLITIDADARLAAFAKTSLGEVAPHAKVEVRIDTFAQALPQALVDLGGVDLAFIDGHHAEAATIAYFDQIRPYCHERSILIFDDVHWSEGMERAWAHIKVQPGVSLSIDLYRWGIIFLDAGVLVPQHLTIVPWRWKVWHMGFFGRGGG